MAKAYVIFTEEIHDPEMMNEYTAKAIPTIMGSGCTILGVTQSPNVLEGEWHGNQTVLLEFESVEAAEAWYNSDAYNEAKPIRLKAANCNAAIIPGL